MPDPIAHLTPQASGTAGPEAQSPAHASGTAGPEASGTAGPEADDGSAGVAEAVAYLRETGLGVGEDGQAPAVQPPAVQPPAGVPGAPAGQPAGPGFLVELPDSAEIERLAHERATSRAAEDQALLVPRQLQQLKAELKAEFEALGRRQGPTVLTDGLTPEQVEALSKAKTRTEQLEILVRADLAPQEATAEAQIARGVELALLKLGISPAQVQSLLAQNEPAPEPSSGPQASAEAGKAEFVAYLKAEPSKFPRLSAMPPRVQATLGWDYMMQLADLCASQLARGEQPTYDLHRITNRQIAAAVERNLSVGSAPAPGLSPAPNGASTPGTNGAPPAPNGAPITAPGLPPAALSGTIQPPPSVTSVTAAHVSEGGRREPENDYELIQETAAWMRSQQAARA